MQSLLTRIQPSESFFEDDIASGKSGTSTFVRKKGQPPAGSTVVVLPGRPGVRGSVDHAFQKIYGDEAVGMVEAPAENIDRILGVESEAQKEMRRINHAQRLKEISGVMDERNMNGAQRLTNQRMYEEARSNPNNPYRSAPNPLRQATEKEIWAAENYQTVRDKEANISPRANHYPRKQVVEFYRMTGPAHLGKPESVYHLRLPAEHGSLLVLDPVTGDSFVMRAGPQDGALFAKIEPADPSGRDYRYAEFSEKIGTAQMSFAEAKAKAEEFNRLINGDKIKYRALFTNSNSYESAAEAYFNLARKESPSHVWMPGWGRNRQGLKEEDEARREWEAAERRPPGTW